MSDTLRSFRQFLISQTKRNNALHHALSDRLTLCKRTDTLRACDSIQTDEIVCYYAGSYIESMLLDQVSHYAPTMLFPPTQLSGYAIEGDSYRHLVGSSRSFAIPCIWAAGSYVITDDVPSATNVRIGSTYNESPVHVFDVLDDPTTHKVVTAHEIETVGSRALNTIWSYALIPVYATKDIEAGEVLRAPAHALVRRTGSPPATALALPPSPTQRALSF